MDNNKPQQGKSSYGHQQKAQNKRMDMASSSRNRQPNQSSAQNQLSNRPQQQMVNEDTASQEYAEEYQRIAEAEVAAIDAEFARYYPYRY